MVFGSVISSPLGSLSPQKALELANIYLNSAYKASDPDIALVLCHDTEVSLFQAKKAAKHTKDQMTMEGIAVAYIGLGKLLGRHGHVTESRAISKKGEKLGGNAQDEGPSRRGSIAQPLKKRSLAGGDLMDSGSARSLLSGQRKRLLDVITIPAHIFVENVRPPAIQFKLPEADGRLYNTPQLACCLGLLQTSHSPDEILETAAEKWLETIEKDIDEQDRLRTMATEVIRVFKRDELKDAKAVAEVVCLAPALDKDTFHELLAEFYSGIVHSGLLKFQLLEGLAQLIQGAEPGHLGADDLVKILELISTRLRDTHQQSTHHMHQLTLAVSNVLDAMADTNVTDLDRETLHEPLSNYLGELKKSSDPYLVYQAAYAYQALLCVPDNETKWQAAMRRTGTVIKGVSGLVSGVKGFDLNKFIVGLGDIQKGFEVVFQAVQLTKSAYDDISSLTEGGKRFMDCLKEGFSFDLKRDWYSALRGADVLIRDGELATFKELACKAPCRLDPAFQWGVCQRLGVIAVNPAWSTDTRRDAIAFLGEIYRNDEVWGQHASVKQWILNILMQLSTSAGTGFQLHAAVAETVLRELEASGDDKYLLHRICIDQGPLSYPLKVALPELGSPSLLDRVQNRPDVETNIRLLRKQRTKEPVNAVYIPPQAKSSLNSSNDTRFPLMERVKEFLESNQKVFLLHGDSGSGKSTFHRELEIDLWRSYKKKTGRIPLHINLPAIDKPENDMIAKQLRRAEFSEAQIREMKHYRKFILICDGYDESQQTHNLYVSNRLNQPGEWDAQMVISCRTEYLGVDYQDRFQPGDRNNHSDSSLFQEAVITPFSIDQVQTYIRQYVSVHQPIWRVEDYKQALEDIPSLNDLMTNPFLMTLSLEVLPRMVDPGHLSVTQVTRVGLYDHFIEQWLERGKKRIGEKDLSPQARAMFDRLSDEGFTQNGIGFLKKLAVAVYKEQGGHPVVEYSQSKDEGSWKDEFFLREDKQLLREACPLRRNGNQHRFIHRSLLEYGLARAVFDPQDGDERTVTDRAGRRGSTSSTLSFEISDLTQKTTVAAEQGPDIHSPLAWRSFVNDHSLMEFLEERAQKEPVFKQQLLTYIEHSKKDKKWRIAASNAITILVRAGVQFIGADLRGIRIPGADLSYGVFDSANLQDTDLRKVHLRGAWLRQADLSRAQMTGVQFGELPFLTEEIDVLSCAYSPDGKSLAVSLENGYVSVYTTLSWEKTWTLSGHESMVRCVAYSPSGDQIATASTDMTVRLWESRTGSVQRILVGHTHWIWWVAYSPRGDHFASASADRTVRLWDVTTGDCIQTLQGHDESVTRVLYSPKGHEIASCGWDYTVRLWRADTGECSHILSGHDDCIWGIAFSPQGDRISSVSADKTIRIWDTESGACLSVMTGHTDSVEAVAYSPKGDRVASGSADGTIRLWDAESAHCLQTLTGHTNVLRSIVFSPNGNQVASGSDDRTVRLWDVSSVVSRFAPSGHSMEVCNVKCSPVGDMVASCSTDKTIRLWDLESGTCCRTLSGHNASVFSFAYSPRGDRIASGSADSTVRLWDLDTGTCRYNLSGHFGYVECVAFSPRGDVVASASDDMTVKLWDVATGDCLRTLDGHTDAVMGVAYSPKGNKVASGGIDATVRIWDAGTGECCQILVGHTNWVRDVAYSPQGNQLASAGYDKAIRLWDVETGESHAILTGHSDRVISVMYSRQGDLLVSGSWDKTARLWDVAAGECRAEIRNFQGPVPGIAWGTTSDYLVTGCHSSVLKWEVVNEEELCRVRLLWNTTNGVLTTTGASIQDVHGLTPLNKQLLSQRGAIGKPVHALNVAERKVASMASVVSILKQPSVIDFSSAPRFPMEQRVQLES